ncbi:M1 family metallopeptidase [Dactylosporangium sp. CA-092794]|uniref:M1 family metallopeptidase n=1 Tax=Dactylosporangium sp. CA-092794 TaxID=3239929 RepID=UPI003D92A9FC
MRRAPARAVAAVVVSAVLFAGGCSTSQPVAARPLPVSVASADAAGQGNRDGTSTPVADPIYPAYGNPALDVLHYGLVLDWAPQPRRLTGTATIRLRVVTAVSTVRLDFSPAYTIGNISVDGTAATGRVSDGDLVVDRALPAGAVATLVVTYNGTPATVPMPSHRGDVEPLGLTVTADGELWTMQEPYGASTWYPANDQPSDKALYDIAVTVPDGWAAIAGGTPQGQDGDTFRYTSAAPMASYLTTLAVGKYTKTEVQGPGNLPVTLWTRTGDDAARLAALRRTPDYLRWLEDRFGPFPFPSIGVVLVPSQSAMETQQMITVGADVVKDAAVASSVLVHEFAHQWFGDEVGPATWQDVWLNEGWASYTEELYRQDGVSGGMDRWERQARAADADLRHRLGPPGHPRADSFAENNVYLCPALMLHQIHKALGDQRFFALARAWATQNAGTARDRAAFTAFVNRQTGRDFTDLINAWLDSPTTPS